MKKDLEWLKGKIKVFQKGEYMFTDEFNAGVQDTLEYVLKLLDQLDEPEILTQEWIDENKKDSGVHYIGYYVPIGRLHGLLVPKQELPIIPKYIADWIEGCNWKLEKWKLPSTFRSDVKYKADQRQYEWANKKENMDIFMKAILLGYEVEEEQKYRIELPNSEHGVVYIAKDVVTGEPVTRVDVHNGDYVTDLTEDEIKKLDSRFLAFAKPVEELEE